MINKLLPEFCVSGRGMPQVGGIIVHHFSCMNVDPQKQFDIEACYQLMIDLNLPKNKRGEYLKNARAYEGRIHASAHVFIDRDGEVYKTVDFDKQAYHAGSSILNGKDNCNGWTIGVELIGTATSGFTEEQYVSLSNLCAEQMKLNDFTFDYVEGHDLVRRNSIEAAVDFNESGDPSQQKKIPKKKYDPSGSSTGEGDNFDWDLLETLTEATILTS